MKPAQRCIAAETVLVLQRHTSDGDMYQQSGRQAPSALLKLASYCRQQKTIVKLPVLPPLPYGLAMTQQSPVTVAEELLQLVKLLHPAVASADARDAQEIYDARKRVQQLSSSITRSVCGPLEYTVLLAGERSV